MSHGVYHGLVSAFLRENGGVGVDIVVISKYAPWLMWRPLCRLPARLLAAPGHRNVEVYISLVTQIQSARQPGISAGNHGRKGITDCGSHVFMGSQVLPSTLPPCTHECQSAVFRWACSRNRLSRAPMLGLLCSNS